MGEDQSPRSRRFLIRRPNLPMLFTSRTCVEERSQRADSESSEDDGPKTPRIDLGLPSTRLYLPHLRRTSDGASPSQIEQQPEPVNQLPVSQIRLERSPTISEPVPSHGGDNPGGSGMARSRFRGADPGETHLADVVDRRQRRRHGTRRHERDQRPKRFLFCFPWVKSRRIRSHILRCFVSGVFLMLMLAVCERFELSFLLQDTDSDRRSRPFNHQKHQQQRVYGPLNTRHSLCDHLLLPRPD